jgi:murein tripeptide amidase MpaA
MILAMMKKDSQNIYLETIGQSKPGRKPLTLYYKANQQQHPITNPEQTHALAFG